MIALSRCCDISTKVEKNSKTELVIALAGNANVGKSVIFNQLTSSEQTIGNWPGKTVERAEGRLHHHGKNITILDLPGIYSLSTYSPEEIVSREYIALEYPDAVINVIDATVFERNLFFTLQLLEMDIPMVIALNLVDVARKKGVSIDCEKFQEIVGVPVTPTIATKGIGVHEIVDNAIAIASEKQRSHHMKMRYGYEVEKRVEKLCDMLESVDIKYPRRWTAIKLLEGDSEIMKMVAEKNPNIGNAAKILAEEISHIHKEPCSTVIASERYAIAANIAKEVQTISKPTKPSTSEFLEALSMHGIWGYVLMFAILLSILAFISVFGAWVAETMEEFFESINPNITGILPELLWSGGVVGFYAALSVALGFILPFYIIIGILEDSGYLPKIAYLMDRPCHAIGLHGKACMPLLLAFGCNVPACVGCRIMETRRDRFIAIFLSTLIPCSARTAVVLGLVGAFVGLQWALVLYIIDFLLIFLVGRGLNKFLPGSSIGIIMEMSSYRVPSTKVVLKQAWSRFRPFLIIAIPLIVIGSMIIEAMRILNILDVVSNVFSPITVHWLGLPAFTGVLLIFGILRKEAALVLLATIAGTVDIGTVLSPIQMVVFSLVMMIYIPCIATIAALVKELKWKKAMLITFGEMGLALLIGGITFRILTLVM